MHNKSCFKINNVFVLLDLALSKQTCFFNNFGQQKQKQFLLKYYHNNNKTNIPNRTSTFQISNTLIIFDKNTSWPITKTCPDLYFTEKQNKHSNLNLNRLLSPKKPRTMSTIIVYKSIEASALGVKLQTSIRRVGGSNPLADHFLKVFFSCLEGKKSVKNGKG